MTRVLVNYDKADKGFLPILAFHLRKFNIEAFSTAKELTISELYNQALTVNADAILIINDITLGNCVPGDNPTLDKWRGSRLNIRLPIGGNKNIPAIVLNKLAHIKTVSHGSWLLEKDLEKLKYIHREPVPFGFKLLDSKEAFSIAYAELSKTIAIAHDIETKTFPLQNENTEGRIIEVGKTVITCAAWTGIFAEGRLRTYVLPLIDFDVDHWHDDSDYFNAVLLLKRINALDIPKVMHNGMYDSTHLIRYHCPPNRYTLDTMALAHAEYSELPKTLDFVASYQLYDYIYWKDDADAAAKGKDINKYWGYNAKDTWHTARILLEQLQKLPAYARKNFAEKFPTVYPSLYCNFEGILVDENRRQFDRAEAIKKKEAARNSLRVKFSDANFNPGSWQQVSHYIYKVFGANHPGLGKSKAGTDEMNLRAVAVQHPLLGRLVSDILQYKENATAISKYFDFVQHRGRLLYALNPFGTDTERLACSESSLWCGAQIQNIPPYAKQMLIADDGYVLFEADNKQSEGRTTAYCAQDLALITALETPDKDFYKTLGTLLFGIPYDQVTKEFRNKLIKRIVHGTNYMMGVDTFIANVIKEVPEGVVILYKAAETLQINLRETPRKNHTNEMTLKQFVRMLLDSYHKPFNRIRQWYKELEYEVKTTGYLVSPDPGKHHRRFFGDISSQHSMLRSVVAHQPQNLSVRILNTGYRRIYNELVIPDRGNIRTKAQIHDSNLGQIREGMQDHYAPKILTCMDNPILVHGRILRIPVDIKFGKNWAEQSEKNPNGTKEWIPFENRKA